MGNEMVPAKTRDLIPVTIERARDLDHVPEIWGLYPGVIPRERLPRQPPTRDVLEAMQDELASALVPVSEAGERGTQLAAMFALMLIESFPMQDKSGSQYADRLVERLVQLPADLLKPVVDRLLDTCTHRPAAVEVNDAVRHALARRKLLLMRVQAGLRYWDWLAEERAKVENREQHEAMKRQIAEAVKGTRPPPAPRRSHPAEPPMKPERRPGRMDRLAQEHARAQRTAKMQRST